jgi:acyl carrier protein
MTETMNVQEERLMRCFEAVFPSLSANQIRTASPANVADWNSLSAITLVAVIEDEFKITISLLDLAELDSFDAFREYLSAKSSTHPTDQH